jgi:hypothetical protein
MQDRCIVRAKCTIGSEMVLDTPNGTPTWWGSSESSVHLEIVLILMKDMCTICVEHTIISEKFWMHLMEPQVTWVMWKLSYFQLEIVLVLVQDRCTVSAKCTNGLEIILDALDGTHWWRGSSESSVHSEILLIWTQDRCTVCVERTIGSKIILDAPDGTPRWRGSCGISFLSVWR